MSRKVINARFNSTCAETGNRIKKGDEMLYDYSTKKCYHANSGEFFDYHENLPPDSEGHRSNDSRYRRNDHDQAGDMMQAGLDDYSDRFCSQNNI